jgi:hypothetical protein
MSWEAWGLTLQAVAVVGSAAAAGFAAWTSYRVSLNAAKLSNELQRRDAARYERKLDCLRRVAGERGTPPSQKWLAALNEIVVTFNDAKEVIECLKKVQSAAVRRGQENSDLIDLIKAMMDDLNLNRSSINDEIFLSVLSSATSKRPLSGVASRTVVIKKPVPLPGFQPHSK